MSAQLAHALAAEHYTDPARFAREQVRIFSRTWQYAGHISQVQRPGDYFAFELHGRALFCLRDRDGAIRTFYNVCAHRGHQLVEGSGNRRMLVCPYHAWTYRLDGSLRAAPGADRVPGFDVGAICLTLVRSEIVGGFIFVNLDDEARSIESWYPGLAAALDEYLPDLSRLRPVYTREVEERCNWKVSVENYSECYHCRRNHPTFSSGVVDPDSYDIVARGHMLRHVTKSVSPDAMSYAIDPDSHPHALDYSSWFLWPTFSFQVYPGNVLNTYHWRAVDHRSTRVIRQWFAVDGVESDTLYRLAEQDLGSTVAEDVRIVESVQRGLESGGYRPGPLVIDPAGGVNSEHSIRALYGWLEEAMES
ncbi:MAG: aromatic ring-hydroxylating dioxygenase subunit alpha [Gammaproteobacteria bacterium]|nr:aromatic ring-hydroxylating dioxygenase subunit alpha [Gammaproteobacteria bacterium]